MEVDSNCSSNESSSSDSSFDSDTDSSSSDYSYDSDTESNLGSSFDLEAGSVDMETTDASSSDLDGSGRPEADHQFADSHGIDEEYLGPLYEDGKISILDSHVLIFHYVVSHGLSKKAFSELLQLISVILPPCNKLASSVYKLKQLFLEVFPHVTTGTYNYCGTCHKLINDSPVCCSQSSTQQFLYIPVTSQLKNKLESPGCSELIKNRFKLPSDGTYFRDVYDGLAYKKKDLLSNPNNISLTMNTDGVALFRSSSKSLWPIWLVINELPPTERFSRRNMILAGLWFSKEKPTMTCFLRPLMEEMNALSIHGI